MSEQVDGWALFLCCVQFRLFEVKTGSIVFAVDLL